MTLQGPEQEERKMTIQGPEQEEGKMTIQGNKYFVIEAGRSSNVQRQILKKLHQQRPGLEEVHEVEQCDVILVSCPIVSRAGTDIEAAMNELNTCSESKPAIFMVLHHTFDTNKTIPVSSRFIKRINTLTVDYLFHEDMGLLKCDINDEALTKTAMHFKQQDWTILMQVQNRVLSWVSGLTRGITELVGGSDAKRAECAAIK